MPKKPTKKQEQARKHLAAASHKAKIEYDKLPPDLQTASRWRQTVRKYM